MRLWQLIIEIPDGYLVAMALWIGFLALAPRWLLRLRRRWKQTPRRQQVINGALSLWLGCAALTMFELGWALFYDTTDSFDMTNVSHRWFQVHVQPDLKVLEFSDGTGIEYRDSREFPLRIDPQRKHVCLFGDSFTFGHGVPHVGDRFSNQLHAQLDQNGTPGKRFVISNLSKPGADLVWIEAVLQHLFDDGRQLDAVVYVMCLNDIEAFHPQFMDFNNELAQLRARPSFFLFRDTYFFNWAYYRSLLLTRTDVRNYYAFVKDYYAGPPWLRFLHKLDQVAEMCRAHDSTFEVVVFPFLHNLGVDYPFAEIHRQILEACKFRDIPCIDLLPSLSRHAQEGLTVNPFDAHPNERAHRIVAHELQERLISQLGSE